MQIVALLLVRWLYWVEIDLQETDRQLLSKFESERLLLLPNHPTFHDPIVMFLLSAKLRQAFYYLAAYETFEDPTVMLLISTRFSLFRKLAQSRYITAGLRWCLQRLGMYSIRRGLADRPSITQTIHLISQPECHLVIFPEGGCSFQNDTVMPFRSGAVQLSFQAMQRAMKSTGTLPNLYVIPVAIKYYYMQDMQTIIHDSLTRLEKALHLSPETTSHEYDRLRAIAETILIQIEQEYGLYCPESKAHPWNDRIDAVRLQVIQACERELSLSSSSEDLIRERVYRLQQSIRTQTMLNESGTVSPTLRIEKSLSRLLNFDAIYDGYVAENPTPERFLDTLIRLEREVFDINQPPPKGFRRAVLQFGEPINLKEYFADYQCDRTAVIKQLTAAFQQTVQTLLDRSILPSETSRL